MFSLPLRDDARLRPLEIWHAEEFAAHMDRAREHIRPWVGPAFVTDDLDGARGTLRRYAERQAADGARLYGIWLDGMLVGGVMFVNFDAAFGSCEIGCWLELGRRGPWSDHPGVTHPAGLGLHRPGTAPRRVALPRRQRAQLRGGRATRHDAGGRATRVLAVRRHQARQADLGDPRLRMASSSPVTSVG
ncbi:hypothetical protein GCM10020000_11810 [Streptomyces olivoverticillatus]